MIKTITIAAIGMSLANAQAPMAGFSPVPTITSASVIDSTTQFVFLGPTMDTITVSYPVRLASGDTSGPRQTYRLRMLNRVTPVVSTSVTLGADGMYDYTYKVFNDTTGRDPIIVWSIALPAVDAASSTSHPTWRAVLEPAPGRDDPPPGAVSLTPVKFLTWRSKDGSAVPAGGAITEVHVKSVYKPGITIMYARSAEDFSLPAGIPDVVLQQLEPLRKAEWLNRSILVIGPRFPVEWGKDIIASEFKYGIERMVRAGQLDASSPFISSVLNVLETIGSTGSAGAPVPDTTLRMAKRPVEADIAAAIALSLR